MKDLKRFKEKLEYEINPLLEKKDKEDDKEEKKKSDSDAEGAYEYRNTSRQTKGRVRMLEYDVDYSDLMDFLTVEVPNISWTVPKTRQTFKALRKFLGFQKEKK